MQRPRLQLPRIPRVFLVTPQDPQLRQVFQAHADRVGIPLESLLLAGEGRQIFAEPGETVDGERPLGLGSRLNLLRGFPGTDEAKRDIGWTVLAYTRKKARWFGYLLVRTEKDRVVVGLTHVHTATMSSGEAFQLVELVK